jgi:hypothetical protein
MFRNETDSAGGEGCRSEPFEEETDEIAERGADDRFFCPIYCSMRRQHASHGSETSWDALERGTIHGKRRRKEKEQRHNSTEWNKTTKGKPAHTPTTRKKLGLLACAKLSRYSLRVLLPVFPSNSVFPVLSPPRKRTGNKERQTKAYLRSKETVASGDCDEGEGEGEGEEEEEEEEGRTEEREERSSNSRSD